MIHYISPYSLSKNIGGAINAAITQLNPSPEDWICHLDQDALWLRPDSKAQLEHICANTKYDVLGPVTNRLAQRYQLVQGMFDEFDIRKHVDIANHLHTDNYGIVQSTPNVLAAFCLVFRVKVWEQIKFGEESLQFDSNFSISARRKGFTTGLMVGIYVFHAYRPLSPNPTQDLRHLLP